MKASHEIRDLSTYPIKHREAAAKLIDDLSRCDNITGNADTSHDAKRDAALDALEAIQKLKHLRSGNTFSPHTRSMS